MSSVTLVMVEVEEVASRDALCVDETRRAPRVAVEDVFCRPNDLPVSMLHLVSRASGY